ncbi:hypothetical protein TNCV_3382131 [Trichonephila clavipes]|nr:hypothetical protein TNCV_3382131 [Trichonephila clavipes]
MIESARSFKTSNSKTAALMKCTRAAVNVCKKWISKQKTRSQRQFDHQRLLKVCSGRSIAKVVQSSRRANRISNCVAFYQEATANVSERAVCR